MSLNQERGVMTTELQGEVYMPTIVAVTDLGAGNTGKISAENLSKDEKETFVAQLALPEYNLPATKTFTCVDMRVLEEGDAIQPEENEADPQIAGSLALTETASDLMVTPHQTEPVSELVARNTRESISAGYTIRVHGDTGHKKAGCGAARLLADRSVLRKNAENADAVAPLVWGAAKAIELDKWVTEGDVGELIVTGKENADNDALFDVTPEQIIDIQTANGAEYEELAGEHFEGAIDLKITGGAFAKKRFMLAHPRPTGGHNGAFAAALVEYRDAVFDIVKMRGGTELDAAKRVLAGLLFNVGALKGLTAPETGKGETLPIVLVA